MTLFEQMFDFDGGVKGKMGNSCMHRADNAQGMAGAIKEIGIAEGDVLCPLRDLCSNIREDDRNWHQRRNARDR